MTAQAALLFTAPEFSGPIGVYDSGVGGLSVLKALRDALPGESFLYVADSGHAPYGDRDEEFIESRAIEIASFMVSRGAKAIVLACNTVSVVASAKLRSLHSIPIVAMEPAIKPAASHSRSKTVLVLATAKTIASPSVENLCRMFGEGVRIILQPCPGLVEQVENGKFEEDSTGILLEKYLRPGLAEGADTIVLGCTHYPFLSAQIARIAGPGVTLIEPSAAIARQLSRVLEGKMEPDDSKGNAIFYTSGSAPNMREFLEKTLAPYPEVHLLPASPILLG